MAEFHVICLLLLVSKGKSNEAANQLPEWKATHSTVTATNERGVPMASLTASMQLRSKQGSHLLFDPLLFDHLAHFNRERIPERVVHAKGGGAFGYFETLFDIKKYTRQKYFQRLERKLKLLFVFLHQLGNWDPSIQSSAQGIAVKFYTEDGNWDVVTLNIPAFLHRDPLLFPSIVGCINKNPQTNLPDSNQIWDFISLRPEIVLGSIILFGPDGHPDGFRFMHGSALHTFKMVNMNNEEVYVKFHLRSNQGLKYLSTEEAELIGGKDPDYAVRDLYNAIADKNYPSWTLAIQVMTFQQAATYRWNPFDPTKFWRFEDFPLIPVGRFVLNRNPTNFFADVEQMAMDPGNLIPGIEMGPDILLQARSFAYSDTQRYRLGVNFNQLPVNRPKNKVDTYSRNGHMTFENGEGMPKYFPNSFHGPTQAFGANSSSMFIPQGIATYRDSGDEDNFSFATWYWKEFISEEIRRNTIKNIASSLQAVQEHIRERVLNNFGQVDKKMKQDLVRELTKLLKSPKNN